ncbi:beta-ketoacyl-[acyl-carrier-protein] synthase family protein [Micromonospora sp. CA-248089]|uniref:beta-ketoacyl-[acyl-carrier-protein] synthase family protein n=1 Tax=Micromonospora sp. CA-248089 TaxID=3239960 RepID=UPI003D94314E
MTTEVVVTGLGAVTPLGPGVASTWNALLTGRSGAVAMTDERYASLPVRIAAPVLADVEAALSRVTARRLDRFEQFAMLASREAWADAGLDEAGADTERLAVTIGSGIGGLNTMLDTYDKLRTSGHRLVSPFTIGKMIPDGAASWVALELGARAGIQTPVAACATGNDALRDGTALIRSGKADVVIAGGAEACIHPLMIAGFCAMRALSASNDEPQRAARPFDKAREGFVLGEGAAVMVLESAGHAARRGARVYARLAGAGTSADAHDFAQPDPTGAGQAAAMRAALNDAGLRPQDVRHINAHAAGTPQGDRTESVAIRTVLGDHAGQAVVTSSKAALGHMMGAAGAAESLATVLALHHRLVPPTINLEDLDDEIELDVAREPRELPSGRLAALSNSFGLGGHNVVVAFTTA